MGEGVRKRVRDGTGVREENAGQIIGAREKGSGGRARKETNVRERRKEGQGREAFRKKKRGRERDERRG